MQLRHHQRQRRDGRDGWDGWEYHHRRVDGLGRDAGDRGHQRNRRPQHVDRRSPRDGRRFWNGRRLRRGSRCRGQQGRRGRGRPRRWRRGRAFEWRRRRDGRDRYPDNYDNSHPYRFIIAYHWLSGSASQVFNCQTESIKCYTTQTPFYGLWNLADNSTIFVAPDGLNAGWGNAGGEDVTFTDQIVKAVEDDLCIDKSRLFANGFSYGGGMSKAIGCARADVFRGIAVYSGADFLSGCDGGKSPIAFYGSHATDDPTNAYSSGITILNRFAANNGCMPQTVPAPPSGGHTCVQFAGCSAGHPTRFCAFQGSNRHDPSPRDPGQSTSWNPPEVWKFITQF